MSDRAEASVAGQTMRALTPAGGRRARAAGALRRDAPYDATRWQRGGDDERRGQTCLVGLCAELLALPDVGISAELRVQFDEAMQASRRASGSGADPLHSPRGGGERGRLSPELWRAELVRRRDAAQRRRHIAEAEVANLEKMVAALDLGDVSLAAQRRSRRRGDANDGREGEFFSFSYEDQHRCAQREPEVRGDSASPDSPRLYWDSRLSRSRPRDSSGSGSGCGSGAEAAQATPAPPAALQLRTRSLGRRSPGRPRDVWRKQLAEGARGEVRAAKGRAVKAPPARRQLIGTSPS